MTYSADPYVSKGRIELGFKLGEVDEPRGKRFTAKVIRVLDDGAAQDVIALVRERLHEHSGANQFEAMANAIGEAEKVLGIETGELPTPREAGQISG